MTVDIDLHTPPPPSPPELGELAIAIAGSAVTQSEGQRHLGLLILPAGAQQPAIIHQAWMNLLRRDEPADLNIYSWVPCPGIEATIQSLFVDWLDVVWKQNHEAGIPYGFDAFSRSDFLDDGTFAHLGKHVGLTCASFVASCFACYGLNLLKAETWPIRSDDVERQKELLVRLGDRATPDYLKEQEELIGKVVRIRPEEVAAAGFVFDGTNPTAFDHIAPLGEQVVDRMKAAGAA